MTDTAFELGPSGNDISVGAFAKEKQDYYSTEFAKIQGTTGFPWSWNTMAAVFGPLWGAVRGAWGFFWTFLVLELFALVQVGRGLWGELGAEQLAKYEKLLTNIAKREQQARGPRSRRCIAAAETAREGCWKPAKRVAERPRNRQIWLPTRHVDSADRPWHSAGHQAYRRLLRQHRLRKAVPVTWRAKPNTPVGTEQRSAGIFGAALLVLIWPLTLFRFTVASPDEKFAAFMTRRYFGGSYPDHGVSGEQGVLFAPMGHLV